MKKVFLVLLLSYFILACGSDDNEENIQINTVEIGKGNLYGNGSEGIDEQNLIITDSAAWLLLINQMDIVSNVSGGFSETDIDFSTFTVIAVFDEIKSNGGHSLSIEVSKNSSNVIVNVTDLVPSGDATLVITQPFYIAKIPNQTLPIIFE